MLVYNFKIKYIIRVYNNIILIVAIIFYYRYFRINPKNLKI